MANYKVILKPSVEKDLRSLPRSATARVLKRIESLEEDPLPRQSLKLAGAEALYRLRVGDYRIIYALDTQAKTVTVHYVRHRRDVYRQI